MLLFVCWLLWFDLFGNLNGMWAFQVLILRRSRAGFVTRRLSRWFEVQCDHALHRYRAAVHGVRFETPLFYGVDGNARKYQRSLQKLCILHRAITSDQHLQNHAASLPAGLRCLWIDGIKGLSQ